MYGHDQPPAEEAVAAGRFANVAESWPLYDTACVCAEFFGQESSIDGWFSNFVTFGQQERHSFFKGRTEAQASLAYCNKQNVDNMDFAFEVYSIGLSFWAPGCRVLTEGELQTRLELPTSYYTQIAHFWEAELPRHCSLTFKVQQDIVCELPAMAASPGYGPVGGGASFEHEEPYRNNTEGQENADYHPVMNMAVTQGVPEPKNRWSFPTPIQIPRTATIEGIVDVGAIARDYFTNMAGVQPYYLFGGVDGAPADPAGYISFPARFGITMSLYGKRLVQQRAQYHR
jgi:hypothetical protein